MSKKKNKEDLVERDWEHEISIDETESMTEADLENEEISLIRSKAAEMEALVNDWKDKYLRSMAEFDNYRKRSLEEKSDWIKRASEKLALSMCEVLDNFDRALMQVNDEQKEDSFIKGIMQIEQQFKAALEREGVRRIEALGEEFDPNLHEALAHIPSDFEEGKVAAIIQNGYTMNDKLIRPVRVAVSSGLNENNNKE
ncbi:MAG: nucleotide exchange factor GrpE [Candidatus Cloacimonadaceae bacterium]